MDIKKINSELDSKIPRDCVSTRSGGKTQLSYLETHYVIDRMNQVFGNLNWSCETVEMVQLTGTDKPAYRAKVRLAIFADDGRVLAIKEGYGYGIDKSTLNPHEMAIKEAESDAFKRAAKNLGQSMGLALYDKTQENVEDATPTTKRTATVAAVVTPTATAVSAVKTEVTNSDADIDTLISSASRVVIAKKKASLEQLKEYIKTTYSVEDKSQLKPEQKTDLLNYLRSQI